MSIVAQIKSKIQAAIHEQYALSMPFEQITINETKPEFEGDYTLVTFGLSKSLSKKPDAIAEELGTYLCQQYASFFESFNVIKGFLNLSILSNWYNDFLTTNYNNAQFGQGNSVSEKIMIEYSSPNTNKPLHFGHLRNIFLGDAMARIYKNAGFEVIKANLINDRGIHICKSMIAWMQFGNGATPESTGIKGDHLVGDYYVRFNDEYKKQISELESKGINKEDAEKTAPIMLSAQELLRKWEAGDSETINLWKTMNGWVYSGFDVSYQQLGISFDKVYHESETYLLGKKIIEKGLEQGVLYKKDDNSVWIDLTAEGLDHKLLLRGDGTSVYITQDIGTADLKYQDFQMDRSVYVIGDEQNYHMQVLQLILQKMNMPSANGFYHLSYGMVELPTGKMKSREGTVVDADDMVQEMKDMAQKNTEELGKVDGYSAQELQSLYYTLGLGALKFYLLRVDPKKKMIFNPQESIDFQGFTGPFVQYTHARISSILRKAIDKPINDDCSDYTLSKVEKGLLKTLERYPDTIQSAASEYNASLICNYVYQVAKEFNSFLVDHSILKADSVSAMTIRLQICRLTQHVIRHGLDSLGIQSPDRM